MTTEIIPPKEKTYPYLAILTTKIKLPLIANNVNKNDIVIINKFAGIHIKNVYIQNIICTERGFETSGATEEDYTRLPDGFGLTITQD